MNELNRKILLNQLLVHVFILLIIVVLSIIFTPRRIESAYTGQWIFANSIVSYLYYFIPITCFSFVLSFSLGSDIRHNAAGSPFFKVIQGSLIFLLVAVIIYILLVFILLPWAYQQRADADYRSEYIHSRIEQGIEYLEAGEYEKAHSEVNAVLFLVPRHREGLKLFQELQAKLPETAPLPKEENSSSDLPLNLEYGEILQRAEQFFQEKDWFSSVFYARLALGPDETRNEPGARRILTESLRNIESLGLSQEDEEAAKVFRLKADASVAYNNRQYLDSYYLFKELERISPGDPDAQTFLGYLEPEVRNISFFNSELDEAAGGDIRRNIFVRIPDTSAEGSGTSGENDGIGRFLAAEQMMNGRAGMYFINLEYLEISSDGRITTHVKIPKGKLLGTYLITQAVDSQHRGNEFNASYIVGQPSRSHATVLEVQLLGQEIWAVNPSTPFYDDVNILQLFSLSKLYPQFGKNPVFPQSEILYRILLPFSLINLSLLVIGAAWGGRSRYLGGSSIFTWVFVPLVPFFVLGVFELYLHVSRNLLTSVLILSNFTVSLITLGVSQVILLVIILFYISRQSSE